MDWKAFLELLKLHPKKTVGGVVAILVAGSSFGSWALYAEQCHAQAAKNEQTIEQLVDFQRAVVAEKEADAKAKRQVMQERSKLCLTGKLKDRDLCATVGVEVNE